MDFLEWIKIHEATLKSIFLVLGGLLSAAWRWWEGRTGAEKKANQVLIDTLNSTIKSLVDEKEHIIRLYESRIDAAEEEANRKMEVIAKVGQKKEVELTLLLEAKIKELEDLRKSLENK